MKLLEPQTRIAQAIFRPLSASDQMAPGTDAEYIKPNDRLTSVERLEIYSRSYWSRVLDSLYDTFPGLRAVVGRRAFYLLARAYLADCPSRSFTLGNLGSHLADWLDRNSRFTGDRYALALDMVRLEWAHIEAFDSAAEKVLSPKDLLKLGPEFRAGLQPYIQLLAFHYPVDDLRIQVNRASDERGAASNTDVAQKHRDMRRNLAARVRQLKPEQIFLAVHRLNNTVYYRRLSFEEYRLLVVLRDGLPIGRAIKFAFENSSAPTDEQLSMLEAYFTAWAQLGWLCPPRSSPQKSRKRE